MNTPHQGQASNQAQEAKPAPIRIGELLVLSGLVTQENLDGAVSLSAKLKMPLGRILSMHGHLDEEMLVKSLEILEKVRGQQMSLEHGLSILRALGDDNQFQHKDETKQLDINLVKKHQPILDALKKIGAVSEKQKENARHLSEETGLPGGWVLLGQGLITSALLNAAILCQRTIDNRHVSEEQALACLRIARLNQLPFQEALIQEGIVLPSLQTELSKCQLLLDAGLVNSSDLLACEELASILHLDMEQLLWHIGILEREDYESLRDICAQMADGMPLTQAYEALQNLQRKIKGANNAEYEDRLAQEESGSEALELLKEARVLSQEDLDGAAAKAIAARMPLFKVLLGEGLIEYSLVSALNECQQLLSERSITKDQAKILVGYCAETKREITAALNEFGWRGSRLMTAGR